MKMRRWLSLALTALFLLPIHALAAEDTGELWTREEGDGSYVTVRLPCPQGEGMTWAQTQNLCVRYADTGEPVALSGTYREGWIFATVPASQAGRPLEVFQGEPTQFPDCYQTWGQGDDAESVYSPPIGTDWLNIRGIIGGGDGGNLNPGRVITRAEAFTILLRLLGIPLEGDGWADWYAANGQPAGFGDVDPSAWYYPTAAAAKICGLTNEWEYFRPNDPVTRGEMTVLLCRTLRIIGWVDETERTDVELNVQDAADIPNWALEAYCALSFYGAAPIATWEENGTDPVYGGPLYELFALPEQGATRGEVIEFVSSALSYVPVYPTQTAMEWGFDREMPIIDGSTSTYPYTSTVFAAMFDNYSNQAQFPREHSKSYYSYERLINGEADLLFASTKPTADTLDKAAAAGVELELIPIAYDAMVFFTNSENSAENLTMEQIRSIYVDNAYDNWSQLGGPDAGLIPYCRNSDSGSQAQMEEFFLHGAAIHPDIVRESTSDTMASVLTDVQYAMTEDPPAYALGYSIYYYYQSGVMVLVYPEDALKLLSIEGVYPTDETIADGSYPLAGYNYAVVRADEPEDSPARRMVEFMLSRTGQQCVVSAGFGALQP